MKEEQLGSISLLVLYDVLSGVSGVIPFAAVIDNGQSDIIVNVFFAEAQELVDGSQTMLLPSQCLQELDLMQTRKDRIDAMSLLAHSIGCVVILNNGIDCGTKEQQHQKGMIPHGVQISCKEFSVANK
jgi:hypothetical protein